MKYINLLSERNSGTKWILTILRSFAQIPVSRSNVHMWPTEKSMTNTARREEYPNSLSDDVVNVLVARNIFNWALQMDKKRYHYRVNGNNLIELITQPFQSEMEMLHKPKDHHNPIYGWKKGAKMQYCEGDTEEFREVSPANGIIDLRTKKYKKWLSFANRGNFIILNYDKWRQN